MEMSLSKMETKPFLRLYAVTLLFRVCWGWGVHVDVHILFLVVFEGLLLCSLMLFPVGTLDHVFRIYFTIP